jgi:hypothetical protein
VMVGNDPGKSFEQTCRDQFLAWASPGNSETFFLPMYDQAVGTGNNGQYRIVGLAAFDLCGYRFPGISNSGNECRAAQGCNGPSNRGYICGYFRAKAVTDGGWGTGKDFGLRTVKVVG